MTIDSNDEKRGTYYYDRSHHHLSNGTYDYSSKELVIFYEDDGEYDTLELERMEKFSFRDAWMGRWCRA